MAARRGHLEGSIYQRQDGRWVAAVTLEGQRRKTLYGRTKREALAAMREFELRRAGGLAGLTSEQTLGTFLNRWLEDVARPRLRPRTFQSYEGIIRVRVLPRLGKVRLSKLTAQQIQGLYTFLLTERSLSERSVQYTHRVLHTALKQAVRWNLIARNPVDGAEAPRPRRPELHTLSPDEVRQLLAFVEGTPRFALYALAVTTGLRRGELLGLRWDDIDLDRGRVTVRRTLQQVAGKGQVPLEPKTPRSRRTVALSMLTVEALRHHQEIQAEASRQAGSAWQDTGAVFATSIGTPFEGGVVSRTFQSDLSAAGLPRVRFHDLRHTCATLLLEGDTNPKVVQEMLGHSTIVLTLDVYSHVLPHMQERAATVFDRVLSEDAGQPVAASPGERRG